MKSLARLFRSIQYNQERILLASIIVFGVLFFVLSQLTYYADSEIWGITLAKNTFDFSSLNRSISFKYPFYVLLWFLYKIPGNDLNHFQYARLLFFFVGSGVCVLTYYLAKRVYHRRWIGLLAVFLMLTTTVYLNRAFRVRSDILSLFFVLILVHLNLNYLETDFKQTWKRYTAKFFLMYVLILGTTPKAIFILLWTIVFSFLLRKKVPLEKRREYLLPLKYGVFYPILAGLAFFLGSTLLSWIGFSNRLYAAYYSAWRFYYDALVTWDMTNPASLKLVFYYKFIRENIVFYIITFIPILSSLGDLVSKKTISYSRAFQISTLVLLVSVLSYNDLLPFFIATWIPFMAVIVAGYIYEFPLVISKAIRCGVGFVARFRLALLLVAIFYFGSIGAHFFWSNVKMNTNLNQRTIIRGYSKYLEQFPEATFYDVIGILPRRNKIYKFVGPGQDFENRKVVKELRKIEPDFILYIAKLSLMEPLISRFLAEEYADLNYGIYARGVSYFATDAELRNFDKIASKAVRFEGRDYWVIDSDRIARDMEGQFTNLYRQKMYFYINGEEEGLSPGAVIFRRKESIVHSLELKEFDPSFLQEGGEFLIDARVKKLSVTIYPRVVLPTETHMFFAFGFDHEF